MELKCFPDINKPLDKQNNTAARIFGNRFLKDQSLYEYLIEFLIIISSAKYYDEQEGSYKGFFRFHDLTSKDFGYYVNHFIALRRFIFLDKSKLSKILPIDLFAYSEHCKAMKEYFENKGFPSDNHLTEFIQDLLFGYAVVLKDRNWCAQRLLPICPELLFTDLMPNINQRNKNKKDNKDKTELSNSIDDVIEADKKFDFDKRNFLARGGEVYYLHLLEYLSKHENVEQKLFLEKLIYNLLTKNNSKISALARFVQKIWDDYVVGSKEQTGVTKESLQRLSLSYIPKDRYSKCEGVAVEELINFLNSDFNSIDKMDIFAKGLMLQVFRMMIFAVEDYLVDYAKDNPQSADSVGRLKSAFSLVIDAGPKCSSMLFKRFSSLNYSKLESSFRTVVSIEEQNGSPDDRMKNEKSAIKNSYEIISQKGKEMQFIVPVKGKYTRFTINEDLVKFLVLSLVPPKSKVTYDQFLDKVYTHFHFVIGVVEYSKYCSNDNSSLSNEFKKNSDVFLELLKNSGFLDELSDATSIVINPFDSFSKN